MVADSSSGVVPEKPIGWRGSALDDLRAFPDEARREAGYQLDLVQQGKSPDDWKPMPSTTVKRRSERDHGRATRRHRATLRGSAHVTRPGGNVFADLGFPAEEAVNLKMRSRLMAELRDLIANKTQIEAAELLGVSQPRVSDLSRGKIGVFTIDALVNMLAHGGVRLRVSLTKSGPHKAAQPV